VLAGEGDNTSADGLLIHRPHRDVSFNPFGETGALRPSLWSRPAYGRPPCGVEVKSGRRPGLEPRARCEASEHGEAPPFDRKEQGGSLGRSRAKVCPIRG
jgi:hypothetical protein